MTRLDYDARVVEASKIIASFRGSCLELDLETTLDIQARRTAVAPKKRSAKRASDDAHLRADPANKRALDQAIAQIERGDTLRFDPRKPKK